MPSEDNGSAALLSLWSIQESLLQAYRSIFITAQSLVAAIAAAVVATHPLAAIVLTLLGLFQLWIWRAVTASRAKDVTFVQWVALQVEGGQLMPQPLHALKAFQDGAVIEVAGKHVWKAPAATSDHAGETLSRDAEFERMLQSRTRRRMEGYLPAGFAFVWLVISVGAIVQLLNR